MTDNYDATTGVIKREKSKLKVLYTVSIWLPYNMFSLTHAMC